MSKPAKLPVGIDRALDRWFKFNTDKETPEELRRALVNELVTIVTHARQKGYKKGYKEGLQNGVPVRRCSE